MQHVNIIAYCEINALQIWTDHLLPHQAEHLEFEFYRYNPFCVDDLFVVFFMYV